MFKYTIFPEFVSRLCRVHYKVNLFFVQELQATEARCPSCCTTNSVNNNHIICKLSVLFKLFRKRLTLCIRHNQHQHQSNAQNTTISHLHDTLVYYERATEIVHFEQAQEASNSSFESEELHSSARIMGTEAD